MKQEPFCLVDQGLVNIFCKRPDILALWALRCLCCNLSTLSLYAKQPQTTHSKWLCSGRHQLLKPVIQLLGPLRSHSQDAVSIQLIAAVSPWLWGSALRWSANGSPLQAWALRSWVEASFISSDPLLHWQTSSELKQIPIFPQILLSAWIFPRRFLICCLLRCQIALSTITGGRNPLILSLCSRFPQTSCRLYTCVHSVTWLVLWILWFISLKNYILSSLQAFLVLVFLVAVCSCVMDTILSWMFPKVPLV